MENEAATEKVTRAEHLQWAKDRAIAYARRYDNANAFASFVSDMNKHTETQGHMAIELMAQLYFSGHLTAPGKMEEFINGFN